MTKKLALLASACLFSASAAFAGEWDISNEVSVEARYFTQDALLPQQFEGVQTSVTIMPDLRWASDNGKHEFVFIPYYRLDAEDHERTHADIREGYYRYVSDGDWSLLVGAAKVFWGTTESRHLVDIINQTDGVEDIDEEDKLGQPMVQLSYLKDWGQLDLYVLPFFRERTFPGQSGRLRTPFVVDDEGILFEDDDARDAVDYAARYSNYFGNWDVGLSLFHGTSREPRFVLPVGGGNGQFKQYYDRITQAGVDLQYTKDAWLWKFEGILREGQGDTFTAAVAGLEYTFYQTFDKPWDIGVIAEYLYDGRDEEVEILPEGVSTAAPITPFDNDIFFGSRLAFNDIQDSSILAGAIVDVEDQTTSMSIEAERRVGQDWKAEFEGRFLFNADGQNPLKPIENDDFLNFRLTRYF